MFSYIDRTLAGLALIGTLLWTLNVLVPDVVGLLGTNTEAVPGFTLGMWSVLIVMQVVKYAVEEDK